MNLLFYQYYISFYNYFFGDEISFNCFFDKRTFFVIFKSFLLSIKKYQPAVYDNYNQGHFGLNLNSYTHFTSPIRRYFDVRIHRLLAGTSYENIDAL